MASVFHVHHMPGPNTNSSPAAGFRVRGFISQGLGPDTLGSKASGGLGPRYWRFKRDRPLPKGLEPAKRPFRGLGFRI